jgi:hypothetical protein
MKKHFIHFLCFLLILSPILAQKISKDKKAIIVALDQKEAFYQKTALTIWNYAEIGYQEYKSSQLLQDILKNEGFTLEVGVAGLPTGFVASYGSGNRSSVCWLNLTHFLEYLKKPFLLEKKEQMAIYQGMLVVIICSVQVLFLQP